MFMMPSVTKSNLCSHMVDGNMEVEEQDHSGGGQRSLQGGERGGAAQGAAGVRDRAAGVDGLHQRHAVVHCGRAEHTGDR